MPTPIDKLFYWMALIGIGCLSVSIYQSLFTKHETPEYVDRPGRGVRATSPLEQEPRAGGGTGGRLDVTTCTLSHEPLRPAVPRPAVPCPRCAGALLIVIDPVRIVKQ